jgi:acyl-CoA synthetase (AMP-forming)/AMP-acid ligase II
MNSFSRHSLVHHFLEESEKRYPAKTALVHGKTRASYGEINLKANQLAHWLLNQGLGRGGRVVLLLENSLEYVVSYYGILKAAGVAVPLSPALKPADLIPILEDVEADFIIAGAKSTAALHELPSLPKCRPRIVLKAPKTSWPNRAFHVLAWEDLFASGDAGNPGLVVNGGDMCSIIYTSGSTGRSKGVVLSHANIVSNTQAICEYMQLTASDIQLVVLPFFYVMGKSLLNTHVAVGGQVVLNNQFAYPATVVRQLASEKVTGFSGVPSTFAYLLHRSPLEKYREELTHLRYCAQAGGAMSRYLKTELRRVLPPHVKIYLMYGATEAAARLSYLDPDDFEKKMDSIGKPVRDVKLRVLDAKGMEAEVGQQGELVASGPNIMLGYWKDPQTTAKVLNSNGYRTGDIGYRDTEGFFFIVGRKDGLLKIGGHRINPEEVEEALMESGLLTEVAVVGVPDRLLGAQLCALAVPRAADCSEREIMIFAVKRLPRYRIPARIQLLSRLPKNLSTKIDRKECERLAMQFLGSG